MWLKEYWEWILIVDNLFIQMFGSDFFIYCYDKIKGVYVDDFILFVFVEYNYDQWEIVYLEEKGKFFEKEFLIVIFKWNYGFKKLDFINV